MDPTWISHKSVRLTGRFRGFHFVRKFVYCFTISEQNAGYLGGYRNESSSESGLWGLGVEYLCKVYRGTAKKFWELRERFSARECEECIE